MTEPKSGSVSNLFRDYLDACAQDDGHKIDDCYKKLLDKGTSFARNASQISDRDSKGGRKSAHAIYQPLIALIPYKGLWVNLKLGAYNRILPMHCHGQLRRYLSRIHYVWSSLCDILGCTPDNLPEELVASLQGLTPALSKVDRERVFRECHDISKGLSSDTKAMFMSKIEKIDRISTFETFQFDTLLLQACESGILRLAPKPHSGKDLYITLKVKLRENLNSCFCGKQHIKTSQERCYDVLWISLWTLSLRYFPAWSPKSQPLVSDHKSGQSSWANEEPVAEEELRSMAELRTNPASQDDKSCPPSTSDEDPGELSRMNRPDQANYNSYKHAINVKNMFGVHENATQAYVTSFGILRSIWADFFDPADVGHGHLNDGSTSPTRKTASSHPVQGTHAYNTSHTRISGSVSDAGSITAHAEGAAKRTQHSGSSHGSSHRSRVPQTGRAHDLNLPEREPQAIPHSQMGPDRVPTSTKDSAYSFKVPEAPALVQRRFQIWDPAMSRTSTYSYLELLNSTTGYLLACTDSQGFLHPMSMHEINADKCIWLLPRCEIDPTDDATVYLWSPQATTLQLEKFSDEAAWRARTKGIQLVVQKERNGECHSICTETSWRDLCEYRCVWNFGPNASVIEHNDLYVPALARYQSISYRLDKVCAEISIRLNTDIGARSDMSGHLEWFEVSPEQVGGTGHTASMAYIMPLWRMQNIHPGEVAVWSPFATSRRLELLRAFGKSVDLTWSKRIKSTECFVVDQSYKYATRVDTFDVKVLSGKMIIILGPRNPSHATLSATQMAIRVLSDAELVGGKRTSKGSPRADLPGESASSHGTVSTFRGSFRLAEPVQCWDIVDSRTWSISLSHESELSRYFCSAYFCEQYGLVPLDYQSPVGPALIWLLPKPDEEAEKGFLNIWFPTNPLLKGGRHVVDCPWYDYVIGMNLAVEDRDTGQLKPLRHFVELEDGNLRDQYLENLHDKYLWVLGPGPLKLPPGETIFSTNKVYNTVSASWQVRNTNLTALSHKINIDIQVLTQRPVDRDAWSMDWICVSIFNDKIVMELPMLRMAHISSTLALLWSPLRFKPTIEVFDLENVSETEIFIKRVGDIDVYEYAEGNLRLLDFGSPSAYMGRLLLELGPKIWN